MRERKEAAERDPAELAALLDAGGPAERVLAGFEPRAPQLAMLRAVGEALRDGGVLLVEAGTGVGKSLAYGLPAAELAMRRGERVVISTGTINLQEQLIGKDLPAVARILGRELSFVLVKGRHNYLCRRRLADRLRQRVLLEPSAQDAQVEALAEWAERSADGSRSDLDLPIDESLWQELCSDADACLRRKCPHRPECFLAEARRQAEQASVLVVNHHLLFADLALRLRLEDWQHRVVLPNFRHAILDEGHEIEKVASAFFGHRLTRIGALRTLGRLIPAHRAQAGLAAELGAELASLDGVQPAGRLRDPLAPLVAQAREAFSGAFDLLAAACAPQLRGRAGKLRLEAIRARPEWTAVREAFLAAASRAERAAVELERIVDGVEALSEDSSRAAEGRAALRGLHELAQACGRLVSEDGDEHVRWSELSTDGRRIALASAPLSVGELLDRALFGSLRSTVVTSATLSIDGRFDFLASRLGADRQAGERLRCLQLDSPFDFGSQARLAVATDGPDPTGPEYESWLPTAVRSVVEASRGRALVLFTAWGALSRTFELVRDDLEAAGIEPLCQGTAPRDRLLTRFREDESSVLFGTQSFWQGVDVIGPSLSCVIIQRLPFDVPDEPLIQARMEECEKRGQSAFSHFMLPRAVLRFKQGFGRLIRHRADRGVVVVLDRRLLGRSYGKRFLASLPEVEILSAPLRELCGELAAFLDPGSEDRTG
ncbi:MAG: helicase [Deltaproteobacteria bacterium]|nr:helicase [Deltaproteobacteria bacterium]